MSATSSSGSGLPPPTRGILERLGADSGVSRSTPAHAGNTSTKATFSTFLGVYPRPRGEYSTANRLRLRLTGLPPPTRGIHVQRARILPSTGSTPAHAGNTTLLSPNINTLKVYPRPRGEYSMRFSVLSAPCGLPPPTRGIPPAILGMRLL